MVELESLKGIYVLVLHVNKNACIRICALGAKIFQKGTFMYGGSAQNNLIQRVKRHLKKEKPRFWHIDYLLAHEATSITQALYVQADKTQECQIANIIGKKGSPVVGFGCSDCNCKSHLFQVDSTEFIQHFMQPLRLDFK
jgi:Uri superfamily endonuclease